MDPASALALLGKLVVVPVVKDFVRKLPRRNDEAFARARLERVEDYIPEVEARAQERYEDLSRRIDDIDERISERCHNPVLARLHANYARAADEEPTDDRWRMIAFAEAALIDTTLSLAEQSRAERLIRELDPSDVLWLHVIAESAGPFIDGKHVGSDGRVRWRVWDQAGADILVAAGCVRISHVTPRIPKDPDEPSWDEVQVTREGRLVLRVMRLFVRARTPPIEIPGHESRPGDRSVEEAWRVIDAIPGLRGDTIRLSGDRRPRYDFPVRHYQTGEPPPHDAKALLRFDGVTKERAAALAAKVPLPSGPIPQIRTPVSGIAVGARELNDGTWHVDIHGPHDVLRWLADEANALWLA